MDKIAANNHFVVLRKELKKAKAMVCGNLIRKINKFKQEKEKLEDELQIKKVDDKIVNLLNEIKLLKALDSYIIAKEATIQPNQEHWNKVISDCKVTVEQRATARVIVKNNVQKQVKKFRDDHKDCDEWLNEYIEFREKKKEIKESSKPSFRKNKDNIHNRDNRSSRKPRNDNPMNFTKKDNSSKPPVSQSPKSVPMSKDEDELETLHPSWKSKRKEKELLKAAFSGDIGQSNRIKFDEEK